MPFQSNVKYYERGYSHYKQKKEYITDNNGSPMWEWMMANLITEKKLEATEMSFYSRMLRMPLTIHDENAIKIETDTCN